MRYLFDTYRVPSEIHTPREQKCFERDFERDMAKMSKRLQSGKLFRDLGWRSEALRDIDFKKMSKRLQSGELFRDLG